MNIHVILNNVGNGDAIFLALQKGEESLIAVIDGGREIDSKVVIPELDAFLAAYGKKYPDLVIGTHYDNDHIAGLLPLLKYYNNPAIVLWMFDTSGLLKKFEAQKQAFREFDMFPKDEDVSIGSQYGAAGSQVETVLLTTLKKEQEVLDFAHSIKMKVVEPIAGQCYFEGWDEIMVLGPTQEYYKQLFPKEIQLKAIIEDALRAEIAPLHASGKNPCEHFKAEKSPITRVNLLSLIFSINVNGQTFLFTGDAGIDSFYSIPNYEKVLSNIYWLKMPHHGSANNINNHLLELMKPKIVYISGDSLINQNLILCMASKGIEVRTTKDGNLDFKI